MANLVQNSPSTRAISILKNPETCFDSNYNANRMFPNPERNNEEEIQNAPHFSYCTSIIAQEKTSNCLTAIAGLEATFNEVSLRGQGAIDAWWAELLNESHAFKAHLNQENDKTSGTPIEHLKEYLNNVQKLDPSIFSKTKEERNYLAPLLNPIDIDIRKLGRKVSRITSTLKNQTVVLEFAANELMTAWDEHGPVTINHVLLEWDSLINDSDSVEQKPSVPSRKFRPFERSILTGWSRVRSLVSRRRLTTPEPRLSARASAADITDASVLTIKSGCIIQNVESVDDSITQEEKPSGLSNASVVWEKDPEAPINNVEWPSKAFELDLESTVPVEQPKTTTPESMSDTEILTDEDRPPTAPVSNANSKSNWLSLSKEDFNLSSDSDYELCLEDYSSHGVVAAKAPLSALSIFADKFALKLEAENSEQINQNIAPMAMPAIPAPPKKSVHFKDFESSPKPPDFRAPLEEFTKNLHDMIEEVIEKCRFLELRFFQLELKPTWCEPKSQIKETAEVVKIIKDICGQLAHPVLSAEIYDGDKVHLIQNLQSMLQAADKCLHVLQDLNHVVNSERKEFVTLWKSMWIEQGHGHDHDRDQIMSASTAT